MIIVDRALERREEEGRPVRVGLIGTGFMGSGIVRQMLANQTGMRLVATYNRTLEKADRAYRDAGADSPLYVDGPSALDAAIAAGRPAFTDDAMLLCESDAIDVLIEVTGHVEFSSHVALRAIEHGKHLVLMNAELDATVGPILKTYADRAGTVITNADGDQPGVIMNLFRFVQGIGFRPVMAGNIKGLQDVRRTPETQKGFAEKHGQNVHMVTSFADGTKVSMEMAIVANGTGLRCGTRGMYGPECGHARDAASFFPSEELLDGGLVDYILGAEPSPGVFVLGYHEDPVQKRYMDLYKMGDGPFYAFYTPYHLCHFEAPTTAARAALFGDAALTPIDGPVCDVVTTAKRELRAGEVLDGIGGFLTYGELENHETARAEQLLPMGLSEGCTLVRDVPIDQTLTYDDVSVPEGRLSDRLRAEQNERFAPLAATARA